MQLTVFKRNYIRADSYIEHQDCGLSLCIFLACEEACRMYLFS
jgi:hypothetical protein